MGEKSKPQSPSSFSCIFFPATKHRFMRTKYSLDFPGSSSHSLHIRHTSFPNHHFPNFDPTFQRNTAFWKKTEAKQDKNTHSNVEYYHIRRKTSNLLSRSSLRISIAAIAAASVTAEFSIRATTTSSGRKGSGGAGEAAQGRTECRQGPERRGGKVWRGEARAKALGEEGFGETAVKAWGEEEGIGGGG